MKEAFKCSFVLMAICFIAASLLVGINGLTSARIEKARDSEKAAAFVEVLPRAARFEPVEKNGDIVYYRGLDINGKVLGAVFTVSAKGYSSVIEAVAGMLTDGSIEGIKIISHNETPGLGSRIAEEPAFLTQFRGKKANQLDKVQAITGATVSSRAVINAVKEKARIIERLITGFPLSRE